MRVKLQRLAQFDKQTLGRLSVIKDDIVLFTCRTIELPERNNEHSRSRIPSGRYPLNILSGEELEYSRFSYDHLGISDVSNRTGIKVHIVNYFFEIEGCVGVGQKFTDINKDGYLDITNSRDTLEKLVSMLPNKCEIHIFDEERAKKIEAADLISELDDLDIDANQLELVE